MTPEQAFNLKSFNRYCTCGGYAKLIHAADTHQSWCAQFEEYTEWLEAMDKFLKKYGSQLKPEDKAQLELDAYHSENLERTKDIIDNMYDTVLSKKDNKVYADGGPLTAGAYVELEKNQKASDFTYQAVGTGLDPNGIAYSQSITNTYGPITGYLKPEMPKAILSDEQIKQMEKTSKQEKDPTGADPKLPGAKLDAGKAPLRRGLLEYFPRACLAVAEVSASGANKYTWDGWQSVPNGTIRYGDAELRHVVKAAIEGPIDNDFGHLHAAHEAWNALARLELILRNQENV